MNHFQKHIGRYQNNEPMTEINNFLIEPTCRITERSIETFIERNKLKTTVMFEID